MQIAQTYPQLAVQLSDSELSSADLRLVRIAFETASMLFAGMERGSGKPFIDHVVGVASGVLIGGGGPSEIAAGLLHAAYDQGDFGDGRSGVSERRRAVIRGAVGSEVEDLVHRYHALGWSPEVARRCVLEVRDATSSERAVLLLRVANELDDVLDAGLVLSQKTRLDTYDERTLDRVRELAEVVASADLASIVRIEFDRARRDIPLELIIGGVGSRARLSASSTKRCKVRSIAAARRVALSFRWRTGRVVRAVTKHRPHRTLPPSG